MKIKNMAEKIFKCVDCMITKDNSIMAIKRGRKQKMIFTLQKSPEGYNKLSLKIIKK